MKKKYCTDELVKSIEETYLKLMDLFERFIGGYLQRKTQYDRMDAIIARLKNADELAEVATIIADKCLEEYPVSQRMLRKAIADYNGKEEQMKRQSRRGQCLTRRIV